MERDRGVAAVSRAEIEAHWLDLTRRVLPAAAARHRWPVSADHCFQRILLDNACGACWYDFIPARPAYRHAPLPLLARAIAIGEALAGGEADMTLLNARSLAWRAHRHGNFALAAREHE